MTTKYIYDGTFRGNILVLGRTECGKTSFVQKLALYDFFGELKKCKMGFWNTIESNQRSRNRIKLFL